MGDTIDIAGEPFRVVGVFESDSWFENGGLVVPLAELQRMMGRKRLGDRIRRRGRRTRPALDRGVEAPDRVGGPGGRGGPARDYVQGDIQIRLAKAMAWATSVIALILGSVGVLNTMMMAVFERTGEIGVLRALGLAAPAGLEPDPGRGPGARAGRVGARLGAGVRGGPRAVRSRRPRATSSRPTCRPTCWVSAWRWVSV